MDHAEAPMNGDVFVCTIFNDKLAVNFITGARASISDSEGYRGITSDEFSRHEAVVA